MQIRENKLFRHRPEARQAPLSHPPYLYEWPYIFLSALSPNDKYLYCWDENLRMHFLFWRILKMVVPKKMPKTKNINFRISTTNYHRYTQFTSRYMFLTMTNTTILVKNSLPITKDFKIQMAANFDQKHHSRYEINEYASLNIALIVPKKF